MNVSMTESLPVIMGNAAKLVPVPAGLAKLPLDPVRGFHVPWFVAWIEGKPEWRCADDGKRFRAIKDRLCWVCGESLPGELQSKRQTFLLGPMCLVNRVSAEPPMHHECALYSARVCPFLSRPAMERRHGADFPEGTTHPGFMIMRNPGVTIAWETNGFKLVSDGSGGSLFRVNEALRWSAWREGRTATHEEILESITTGLPILEASCQGDPEELAALRAQVGPALKILGLGA